MLKFTVHTKWCVHKENASCSCLRKCDRDIQPHSMSDEVMTHHTHTVLLYMHETPTQEEEAVNAANRMKVKAKYLGVLCVLLQCMRKSERQACAARRWSWRWRRKRRRRSFIREMRRLTETSKRYKRRRHLRKRWRSEWHQAAGMNINQAVMEFRVEVDEPHVWSSQRSFRF